VTKIYGKKVVSSEFLSIDIQDELLEVELKMKISPPQHAIKKCIFVLFINGRSGCFFIGFIFLDRLVESREIKREIGKVYCKYVPRGMHPFIYLSININPRKLDVNIHATKNQVRMAAQDRILTLLVTTLSNRFQEENFETVSYVSRWVYFDFFSF